MAKHDNVIQIAKFGRDPEWFISADPQKGETTIDGAARAWANLKHLDDELSTRLEAVSHDENLSPKGRAKARAAAHKANQIALAPVRKVLARLANDLKTLRTKAEENINPNDALLAHLKAQEIRSWLGSDPLNNFIAANTAAEQGDTETLNAILDSPGLWPGRPSDDKLTHLRDQRMEGAAGKEATQEAQALAEVHDDLSTRLGIQLDEATDNHNRTGSTPQHPILMTTLNQNPMNKPGPEAGRGWWAPNPLAVAPGVAPLSTPAQGRQASPRTCRPPLESGIGAVGGVQPQDPTAGAGAESLMRCIRPPNPASE